MAGGGTKHINVTLIEQTAAAVKRLRDDFANAERIAGGASDSVGSGDISDALHTFSTNWNYHKRKLTEALDAAHEKASTGAEAWRGLDQQYAQAYAKGGL